MPATSWSMLLHGRRAAHTLLLTLAVAVPATSVFVVGTILPSVVADIGGAAFYAWSTMLYTVASILGTASGGFLKATLGLRRGYMAGALVFLVGSVGCAVAPHMLVLLGARIIQGGGGGALIALSFGMVGTLYPEDWRPRVLSTISGVWGAAALYGPMVGGVFAELGWWRGAFWVDVPVIMVVLGLIWRSLPSAAPAGQAPPIPLLRLALLGLGVLCVAGSGHVAPLGMRLALIGSAGIWVVLAFRDDARAAHRLFPSQPLALTTPVGTGLWIVLLFGVTSSLSACSCRWWCKCFMGSRRWWPGTSTCCVRWPGLPLRCAQRVWRAGACASRPCSGRWSCWVVSWARRSWWWMGRWSSWGAVLH